MQGADLFEDSPGWTSTATRSRRTPGWTGTYRPTNCPSTSGAPGGAVVPAH
ncbi:hypothetical protein [Arthrobacter sp. JCM 19049]|uniref:hypothetical protein n=1 Tax=Arthrobacter sp. JCM 19049 TaxID=1460643 RepID=UPI002436481F|nr:hypothetical protein [Arthrobacter sp. JCM 19049]